MEQENIDYLIVTTGQEAGAIVNPWLKAGWLIKSITAENVSITRAHYEEKNMHVNFHQARGYIIIALTIDANKHNVLVGNESKYVNDGK